MPSPSQWYGSHRDSYLLLSPTKLIKYTKTEFYLEVTHQVGYGEYLKEEVEVAHLEGCHNYTNDRSGQMETHWNVNVSFVLRMAAAGGDTMKALVGNPHPNMLHQCKLLPSYCRLKFTNLASFYMYRRKTWSIRFTSRRLWHVQPI